MTSDARAICAAILLSQDMNVKTAEEAAKKISGAVGVVEALETALGALPPSDAPPSLNGLLPKGLMREWLNGARARVEAAQTYLGQSEADRELGEVLAYLGRCQQQLDSL